MMLERALSKANIPMNKHNIWEDAKAAEFVRAANNGNETVPTIRVGDQTLTNPSADQVLESLRTSGV